MNSSVSQAVRLLDTLLSAAGVTAALLVDTESGCCILSRGGAADGDPDLSRLASRHAAAIRERARAARASSVLADSAEEVVLTLQRSLHLVRMTPDGRPESGLFVCVVADRSLANLAVLRRQVAAAAEEIELSDEEREAVRIARRHARPREEPVAVPEPPLDYSLPNPDEELPPYLRTESVLRLLGITEGGDGRQTHAPAQETDASPAVH